MLQCIGYAAKDAHSPLEPWRFERREPGPRDIQIDILFRGVCHSDLHQARDEWHNTIYPCLPGLCAGAPERLRGTEQLDRHL